jgi:MFS family permease
MPLKRTFRSLAGRNYRLWAAGTLVSNIGTWMQRTGQDWLVLTELTDNNATALGLVMALQFGPHLLLLPWTGYAADRLDKRRLLFATKSAMGLLALGLGLLVVTGTVELWHVYIFAFALGCASALDAPARQTFVSELVAEHNLANAVALNSASFNSARMVGPAIAGVLIAAVGTGWVFLLNAATFIAVLSMLAVLRTAELQPSTRAAPTPWGFLHGFLYVRRRPDLMTILAMLFLIGTFGLNFPIYISTMCVTVFEKGADTYGLLISMMAIGTVAGALLAAGRERPQIGLLVVGASVFGAGLAVAALMPTYWLFGLALIVVGISAPTFMTSTNAILQLTSEPAMRGRVMAIRFAITMGGTPIGAPIAGWIADTYGGRWAWARPPVSRRRWSRSTISGGIAACGWNGDRAGRASPWNRRKRRTRRKATQRRLRTPACRSRGARRSRGTPRQ